MQTPWEEHTEPEELANFVTHAAGLVLAGIGAMAVMWFALGDEDLLRGGSLLVYGLTLVLLYAASALYHGIRDEGLKHRLRLLDHSAVFLFIAGTYTPVALVGVGGAWGWAMFAAAWLLALGGILLKRRRLGELPVLGPVLYLAMGWLSVVAVGPMMRSLSAEALAWLAAGGVLYTAGVGFYAWKRLPYNHAIWHLFVLGGSAAHYLAVTRSVLPPGG